jgi:hypothetical protein
MFLRCWLLSKGGRHAVSGKSKTTPFSGDRPSPTICSTFPFDKYHVWIAQEKETVEQRLGRLGERWKIHDDRGRDARCR